MKIETINNKGIKKKSIDQRPDGEEGLDDGFSRGNRHQA